MSAQPRCFPLPGAMTRPFGHGPFAPRKPTHLFSRPPALAPGERQVNSINSTFLKTAPLLLAAGLALSGANAVHAQVTINYSLGAFTFNAPTNYAKFELNTRPNTLTLLPGVAQTVNIQGINFYVNDTNDFSGPTDYIGNVSRTLTVNGTTQSAVQGFDLTTRSGDPMADPITFANDDLTLTPGNLSQVLTFNLGSQGTLKFTPETIDGLGFFNKDAQEYQSNVQGKFLLTPAAVPESSTTVSLGLLLGGLALLGIRARKRGTTGV